VYTNYHLLIPEWFLYECSSNKNTEYVTISSILQQVHWDVLMSCGTNLTFHLGVHLLNPRDYPKVPVNNLPQFIQDGGLPVRKLHGKAQEITTSFGARAV